LALAEQKSKTKSFNYGIAFWVPQIFYCKDHLKEKLKDSNRSVDLNELSDQNNNGYQ